MPSSLQALLAGVLDYAGLFPPTKLPLDQAIQRYARYRHDPDSWMLGRFICPAEKLEELTPFVQKLFSAQSPLPVSVLGRGGKSFIEFLTGLLADVKTISAFQDRHSEQAKVSVYETRVPDKFLTVKARAHTLLDVIATAFKNARRLRLSPYLESEMGSDWRSSVIWLSAALAKGPRLGLRKCVRPAGIKLRCGGLEAAAFPSPKQVAFVITACRDAGVPLKFTAGLHHPLRHSDIDVQTRMHGFLNVFGAGVLAHARRLSEGEVRQIIEDEAAEDFAFDDKELRWKNYRASVAEIRAARQSAVISFGSCSFEEPRDDLRAMGLLK